MDKSIESEIVFVTTTILSKWMSIQANIIKKLFPNSEHIIVDGCSNWPYSWFYWINEIKKSDKKYYIHIDEDFFITDRQELLNVIKKMDDNKIDIIGCSDGYHEYRGANPVAINSFLMFGRVNDIKRINIDFNQIKFGFDNKNSYLNNFNLKYNDNYKKDFSYSFKISGNSNFEIEQEPYYAFLWCMKELGCKFDYLYPFFDKRFMSTNPRLNENSNDIGIHMWYTRCWNTDMDVHGMKNSDRYKKIEEFLNGC